MVMGSTFYQKKNTRVVVHTAVAAVHTAVAAVHTTVHTAVQPAP